MGVLPDHAQRQHEADDPQNQVGQDAAGHHQQLARHAQPVEGPILLVGPQLGQGLLAGVGHHRAGLVHTTGRGRGQHAEQLDVTAEPDRLDAVLGLTALHGPHARPEADEVLGHLHAESFGGDHVPQLVERNRHGDPDDEDDDAEDVGEGRAHGRLLML